jgi:hypothetical protein
MRPRGLLLGFGSDRPTLLRLPVCGECVDDDYGTSSIVADPVRYVPEEEFVAACHSGVAYDQDI